MCRLRCFVWEVFSLITVPHAGDSFDSRHRISHTNMISFETYWFHQQAVCACVSRNCFKIVSIKRTVLRSVKHNEFLVSCLFNQSSKYQGSHHPTLWRLHPPKKNGKEQYPIQKKYPRIMINFHTLPINAFFFMFFAGGVTWCFYSEDWCRAQIFEGRRWQPTPRRPGFCFGGAENERSGRWKPLSHWLRNERNGDMNEIWMGFP